MSERYRRSYSYSRKKYLATLGIGHSLEAVHARRAIHRARLKIISDEEIVPPLPAPTVPINPDHDRSFFHDAFEVLGLFGLEDKLEDVLTGLKDGFKKD